MNEKIASTADFCRNFPRDPKRQVSRENLYEHVWKIFTDVTRVAYIEGDAMTGKSEFLAGFMRSNPKTAIGVFLSPGDTYFYSPDYVKLVLAEQIHWLVNGTAAPFETVDELSFTRLLHQLQKIAKHNPITFVVDGLAEKGTTEHRLNKEIVDALPFSQSEFRFLISGSENLLPSLNLDRHKPKATSLIPMSKDEALTYFRDIDRLSSEEVLQIREFCKGTIGLMAKVRELIEDGLTFDQVLADKNGGLTKLLEAEWSLIPSDESLAEALSCVCFSNRLLRLPQIAALTGSNANELNHQLARCRFVEIDPKTETVSIRSFEQKSFIQKKLAGLEKSIQERLITELLKHPDSTDATRHLPEQLMRVGRHEDLLRRLDHDHFVRLLDTERSLRTLRHHFQLGLEAARNVQNEEGIAGFGLLSSAIAGLTFSVGSKRRIEALMRLGATGRAIELAMAAPTNEERLELLSATANSLYQNKMAIPGEIKRQVRDLLALVSTESLGNLAADIACNLLPVDPDAAISLFNTASAAISQIETKNKVAIGLHAPRRNEIETDKNFGSIEIKLNERQSQRFANAVETLVERISAEKMIALNNGLEPMNELFMLKQWLTKNKENALAWKVADHALDITLKDRNRAPRIEDFRAIATVLPYIKEPENSQKLIKRIEAQLGTQLTLGTTAESVRLEMLLERARQKSGSGDTDISLINLHSRIASISDAGVKAASLAWMLYGLQRFNDIEGIEQRTTVVSATTNELVKAMEMLLESSADHFQAAQGAIYALARADVNFAFELISKLNVRARRDRAYVTLALELVAEKLYESNPDALLRCISSIENEADRLFLTARCLAKIAQDCESGHVKTCSDGILTLWRTLRVANFRFQGAVASYRILMSTKKDSEKAAALALEIEEIWPHIMVDWVRADLGYYLVRDLAKVNLPLAERWLNEVVDEKQSLKAPSETLSKVLHLTTHLAVMCFGSTVGVDVDQTDVTFKRLSRLINAVPQPQRRMQLWCDLGIKLHYRKMQLLVDYIGNLVQQIMAGDFSQNGYGRELLIAEATPFLYLSRPATANLFLRQITQQSLRDTARRNICTVILRKRPSSEPYQTPANEEYELDQNDVAMLLDVLSQIDQDDYIFDMVASLSASVVAKQNEHKFRRTQVRDFLNTLQSIVERKLPFPENIQHQGYKIAALGYILKATTNLSGGVQSAQWTRLFEDAQAIPNVADRVVVLAMLVCCARTKANTVRPNWFVEIRTALQLIPTDGDRLDRYQWIAELLEGVDKSKAAQLLQDAVLLTNTLSESQDPTNRQKVLLDLAHSINPDLVNRLIDLADTDKASTVKRDEFNESVRLRDLRKKLAENPRHVGDFKATLEQISDLSNENLARLNGHRIPARSIEDFSKLTGLASATSIASAFPIWSWIAENAVRKTDVKGKSSNTVYVNGFLMAACGAGELILALIGNAKSAFHTGSIELDGLVRPGDREAVFGRIAAWAQNNDGKEILISDPFFGPEDLDVLYVIAGAAPRSRVRIVTSRKQVRNSIGTTNQEEAFRAAWAELCDISPPETEIIVLGIHPDGSHPIHDRWLVAPDSGLRLGTSMNSIAKAKISEISDMDADAAGPKFSLISELASRKLREWECAKINFSSFDLTL